MARISRPSSSPDWRRSDFDRVGHVVVAADDRRDALGLEDRAERVDVAALRGVEEFLPRRGDFGRQSGLAGAHVGKAGAGGRWHTRCIIIGRMPAEFSLALIRRNNVFRSVGRRRVERERQGRPDLRGVGPAVELDLRRVGARWAGGQGHDPHKGENH